MISAVIPTYRGGARLVRYLPGVRESLQAAGEPFEIVVVDDAGGDVPAFPFDVVVERLPVNRGYAPAVNAGVARARGDWLLLLNDDVRLEGDTVRHLRACFPQDDVFAAVPAILSPLAVCGDEGGKSARWRDGMVEIEERPSSVTQATFYPVGCCVLCPRDRFLALGGLAEVYAPFFWEDVELGYQAWRRGWRVLHVPEAVCHHEGSATIKSAYEAAERERIWFRNRVLFHLRNVREPARRAALFGALAASALFDARAPWQRGLREAIERFAPHGPAGAAMDAGLDDTEVLRRVGAR